MKHWQALEGFGRLRTPASSTLTAPRLRFWPVAQLERAAAADRVALRAGALQASLKIKQRIAATVVAAKAVWGCFLGGRAPRAVDVLRLALSSTPVRPAVFRSLRASSACSGSARRVTLSARLCVPLPALPLARRLGWSSPLDPTPALLLRLEQMAALRRAHVRGRRSRPPPAPPARPPRMRPTPSLAVASPRPSSPADLEPGGGGPPALPA